MVPRLSQYNRRSVNIPWHGQLHYTTLFHSCGLVTIVGTYSKFGLANNAHHDSHQSQLSHQKAKPMLQNYHTDKHTLCCAKSCRSGSASWRTICRRWRQILRGIGLLQDRRIQPVDDTAWWRAAAGAQQQPWPGLRLLWGLPRNAALKRQLLTHLLLQGA